MTRCGLSRNTGNCSSSGNGRGNVPLIAEYHTSHGRIDMVVQTADFVYVMEFKLDGSAEQALQQIDEKQK